VRSMVLDLDCQHQPSGVQPGGSIPKLTKRHRLDPDEAPPSPASSPDVRSL
jgi:hypothetical protein